MTVKRQLTLLISLIICLPVFTALIIYGYYCNSSKRLLLSSYRRSPEKADVSLTVKDDGLGTAVCPHCGASFDLSNYGCRNDGKGSEVLRKYNSVIVNGNTLIVRN